MSKLDLKPSKAGFYIREHWPGVYLIGSSVQGWYKIGHSRHLESRVKSFKTLPFIINVCHTWRTDERARVTIERELHKLMKNKRIRPNDVSTEWFALTQEDIETVIDTMAGKKLTLTPWNVHRLTWAYSDGE